MLIERLRSLKHDPPTDQTWWTVMACLHGDSAEVVYAEASAAEILAPRDRRFHAMRWAVQNLSKACSSWFCIKIYGAPIEESTSFIRDLMAQDCLLFPSTAQCHWEARPSGTSIIQGFYPNAEQHLGVLLRAWHDVMTLHIRFDALGSVESLSHVVPMLRVACAWAFLHGFSFSEESAEDGLSLALLGLPLSQCAGIKRWETGFYPRHLHPGCPCWQFFAPSVREYIRTDRLNGVADPETSRTEEDGLVALREAMSSLRASLIQQGAIFSDVDPGPNICPAP